MILKKLVQVLMDILAYRVVGLSIQVITLHNGSHKGIPLSCLQKNFDQTIKKYQFTFEQFKKAIKCFKEPLEFLSCF